MPSDKLAEWIAEARREYRDENWVVFADKHWDALLDVAEAAAALDKFLVESIESLPSGTVLPTQLAFEIRALRAALSRLVGD